MIEVFLPLRCCLGLFDGSETGVEVSLVLLRNGLVLRIKELKGVRFAEVDKPLKNVGRGRGESLEENTSREKLEVNRKRVVTGFQPWDPLRDKFAIVVDVE